MVDGTPRARKGLETLSAAKQLAAGNRRPEKRATKCAKSTLQYKDEAEGGSQRAHGCWRYDKIR